MKMRNCKKDKSIRCSDNCKNCHRFPNGREALLFDNEQYRYMTGKAPGVHIRRYQHHV